jgi:hypothetical protein
MRIPVLVERRTTGQRRKGERRVLADRREEATRLTCPVCREDIGGFDLMLNHLTVEHEIDNEKAANLIKKLTDWKQEKIDRTLFPPEH